MKHTEGAQIMKKLRVFSAAFDKQNIQMKKYKKPKTQRERNEMT